MTIQQYIILGLLSLPLLSVLFTTLYFRNLEVTDGNLALVRKVRSRFALIAPDIIAYEVRQHVASNAMWKVLLNICQALLYWTAAWPLLILVTIIAAIAQMIQHPGQQHQITAGVH